MSERNINVTTTSKISISGILIAIGTTTSTLLTIPVFGAKMAPVQHFINVISAVLLGPYYAVLNAFSISLLRNILGTGTLLAFPGSIVGALLASLMYKYFRNIYVSALGEVIGTGIIGALLAYPIYAYILGKQAALTFFIVPFSISCVGGSIIALVFLNIPAIKKFLIRRGE